MTEKVNGQEKKSVLRGIVNVCLLLCSIAVIVLAVVQLTGVWENAIYVYEPLMGINLLTLAYYNWNKNRMPAMVALCGGIFVLICAAVILLVR